MDWNGIVLLLPAFLEGSWVALKLFVLTLAFSLPFGLVLARARMSKVKWLSRFMAVFQYVIRATPLMLQLVFVMYFPSLVLKINGFGRFTAACVAFVINYSAYFSEIYRSGMESIPLGQYEAAKVLGLSKRRTFVRVTLPQMVKRIMPALTNEFMTLVKDTALASVIGLIELLRVAQNHMNRAASIVPLLVALVFYLLLNGFVNLMMNRAEKKLDYYRN